MAQMIGPRIEPQPGTSSSIWSIWDSCKACQKNNKFRGGWKLVMPSWWGISNAAQ